MTEAWRIDSLDARAGMAFGSWRPADLTWERGVDLERTAVFLAPPYFRAQALNDRTVGFSASRSRAQFGVFIRETELAFATLDALSEFVRRVYQTSGGGDLGGGGGPGGPPVHGPEGGGPEIGGVDFPAGGLGGAQAVVHAAREAQDLAESLPHDFSLGEPVPTKTPVATRPSDQNYPTVDAATLAWGAQELVIELIRRFPLKGSHADIVRWGESGNRLGEAIGRLDLWAKILEGAGGPVLDTAAKQIHAKLPTPFDNRRLIWLLMQRGASYYYAFWKDYYPFPTVGYRTQDDPVDDLSVWPLPDDVKRLIGSMEKDPSAFHLMASVCGSPQKLVSSGIESISLRAASIVLFCAARVVGETTPQSVVAFVNADLYDEAIRMATRNSWDWLVQQWPAIIFPTEVEKIIGQSATLVSA